MEKRVLLQYLIDISDITPEKKREATEYLNNLWNVQRDLVLLEQAARLVTTIKANNEPAYKLFDAIEQLAALLP